MFKVCLDNFTGVNVDNLAMLLEGCGRFLLRSEDTGPRFKAMVLTVHLVWAIAELFIVG